MRKSLFLTTTSKNIINCTMFPADQRHKMYSNILNEFNNEKDSKKAAALFLFLNNNAKNNMPIFGKDNKLATTFNNNTNEQIEQTKKRIDAASEIFNHNNVILNSGNFIDCLKDITSEDVVTFDPPYPDLSTDVYFNLSKPNRWHTNLILAIKMLNTKSVPFVLFYGAGKLPENCQFNDPALKLKHLIRLSHSPAFGPYLEHIYIPQSSGIDKIKLPHNIIHYTSYEDAQYRLIHKKH